MKNLALDYVEKYDGAKANPFKPIRSQDTEWDTVLIFENLSEPYFGLLKKENLVKIYDIEKMIITDPTWESICQAQADDNSTCHNETSHVSPL